MSIFTITPTDAPRRTDSGALMWSCPTYTGLTNKVLNPVGCKDCINAIDHNIADKTYIRVPSGQHRYQQLPEAQRQSTKLYNEIQGGFFLWKYILLGYIDNQVPFNATAANNATQTELVTIVSVATDTLVVRGRNPKLLTIGRSRPNTEWPLPDPATGQLGKIVSETLPFCLIPGAAIELDGNSILSGKQAPLIAQIVPPVSNALTDVEYTIKLNGYADISNALIPYDASWTPTEFKANIRWEVLFPDSWKDMQSYPEKQVTRLVREFGTAAVVELLDSLDGPCRIIDPDHANAISVDLEGPTASLSADNIRSRTSFVQTVDGWQTFFDLTGLTFTLATITYWPQIRPGDTLRQQFQCACTHSKLDPSASYKHGATRYCERPTSSGFSSFKDECWLWTNCNQFDLSDPKEPRELAVLHHQAEWVLEQGQPGDSGSRNFQLIKRGGPSVQGFCGSFCDVVPKGRFPTITEFWGNPLGKRIEFINYSGEKDHGLVQGAYYQKPYDFGPAAKYVFNAFTDYGVLGIIGNLIPNFQDDKPDPAGMPFRNTGRCNVYDFVAVRADGTKVNNFQHASESFLVAVDPTVIVTDSELTRIQVLYE